MSQLTLETLTMPAADLGPLNPLPTLAASQTNSLQIDDSIPDDARKHLGWGCNVSALPYLLQDQYNRTRTLKPFTVAILENSLLRATFLLQLGGRLWSLIHKPTGRNL